MPRRPFSVSFALFLALGCGSTTSGSNNNGLTGGAVDGGAGSAPDGIGSTLGGCPDHEPAANAGCAIPGRLCTWTRSCGALDTGWCTSGKTWRVASGKCEPGCPATPTVSEGVGAPAPVGPDGGTIPSGPVGPSCTAGLSCDYPSTPLNGGVTCSCDSGGNWNSLCNSLDDGWKPSANPSTDSCGELVNCGGRSGCVGTCSATIAPGPAPYDAGQPAAAATYKRCGCGEDGFMYCAVQSCGS